MNNMFVLLACLLTSCEPGGHTRLAGETASPDDVEHATAYFEPDGQVGRPVPIDPGRMSMPSGLAVDERSGDVYVADTGNKRVQRFTAAGDLITVWTTPALGGIATDPRDGTVLVTLPGLGAVDRYASDGTLLQRVDNLADDAPFQPWDVSVHPDGRILALEKSGQVVILSPDGILQDQWPALCTEPSAGGRHTPQRARVMSIAAAPDGESVYIACTGMTRIRALTMDGELLHEWGGAPGDELGTLRWSRGVAVAGDGAVVVADTDNERLQVFTPDGQFVRWMRGPHDQEHGIFHPRAVAVNRLSGDIYAAAAYAHRIDRFSSDGTYLSSIGGRNQEPDVLNEPRGVAIHPDSGDIYIASRHDHVVRRFGGDGAAKDSIIPTAGDLSGVDPLWAERSTYQFWGPVAFAEDGTFWMVRQGYQYPEDPTPAEHLRHYDASGRFLGLVGSDHLTGYMEGFDIHHSGDFFLTSTRTHDVHRLSRDGELLDRFGEDWLQLPSGLALDEDRARVYVADVGSQKIQVFSEDGDLLESWGGPDTLHMRRSVGLAVDDCGLLYVPSHKKRRVTVYAPDGEVVATLWINGQPRVRPTSVAVQGDTVIIAGDGRAQRYRRHGVRCD